MQIFRISSRRSEKNGQAPPAKDDVYSNFLRDVMLNRRFSVMERCKSMYSNDPEMAEEYNEPG